MRKSELNVCYWRALTLKRMQEISPNHKIPEPILKETLRGLLKGRCIVMVARKQEPK